MQSGCNNDSVANGVVPAPRRAWLDRVGIGVSITCAIHCVAAALLAAAPAFAATAAPGLGEGLEHLEGALLWIALGVGTAALLPSYLRDHRSALPLALFLVGLAAIAAARSALATALGPATEIAGTVVGVALVASAHLVNLRLAGPHAHAGHAH